MKLLILVVLGMLALVACRTAPGTTAVGSGIEGTVAIGPTCPVQTAESPCEDAPYAAKIMVTSGGGVIATGQSAENGTFRIAVPPGYYAVTAEPLVADSIAQADPLQDIVVAGGEFTHVTILFDSGIR